MTRAFFLGLVALHLPRAAPLPTSSSGESSGPDRMSPLFAPAPVWTLGGAQEQQSMTDVMGGTHEEFEVDYAGAAENALGATVGIVKLANDPTLEGAAKIVGSLGGVAASLIAPPAGMILGTATMLFSGLFGGGSQEPSNQDVLDALDEGFSEMSDRFDDIDRTLARIEANLGEIQYGIERLQAIGTATLELTEQINMQLNWKGKLEEINSAFHELVERYLNEALTDPTPYRWMKFYEDAKKKNDDLGASAFDGIFTKNSVEQYLGAILTSTTNNAGRCGQAMAYQSVLAARFQLFFIMTMGTAYQGDCKNYTTGSCDRSQPCTPQSCEQNCCWLPDSSDVLLLSERLDEEIREYDTLLGELRIKDIVSMDGTNMSDATTRDNLCMQQSPPCGQDPSEVYVETSYLDYPKFAPPTPGYWCPNNAECAFTLRHVSLDTCKNRGASFNSPAMAYSHKERNCVMGVMPDERGYWGVEDGYQTYLKCQDTKPFKSSGLLVTFGTRQVGRPGGALQDKCEFLDGYGSGFKGGALPGAYVGKARSRQDCVDLVRSNHLNATGAEWFSTRNYAQYMSPQSCDAHSDGWDSTPPPYPSAGSCIAIVPP